MKPKSKKKRAAESPATAEPPHKNRKSQKPFSFPQPPLVPLRAADHTRLLPEPMITAARVPSKGSPLLAFLLSNFPSRFSQSASIHTPPYSMAIILPTSKPPPGDQKTAKPPTKKHQKIDLTDVITVHVGEAVGTAKTFILHKAVALKSSVYIQAALHGHRKESLEQAISLPEHIVATFEIYMQWLYTGQVALALDPAASGNRTLANAQYSQLMPSYILGNYLQDIAFQNAIVDMNISVQEEIGICPGQLSVNCIWPNTPSGCGIRRLILRHWCMKRHRAKVLMGKNKEFMKDWWSEHQAVCDDIAAKKDCPSPSTKNKCDYHDHESGTPRCV